MGNRHRPWVGALAFGGALLVTFAMAAEGSESPGAPTIQDLQRHADALTQQLEEVKRGTDHQAREKAMRGHWSKMQDYMKSMRRMPGMQPKGRSDWTLMGPDTTRDGMMGGGRMGHGMMGHDTTHNGSKSSCCEHGMGMHRGVSGWDTPNVAPDQYQQRMQTCMTQMREQLTGIADETDPVRREALTRQHYETMYREMQTMRGMSWMWDRPAVNALPDAILLGATLEAKYCSQCHAAPPPDLHTAKQWSEVTERMQQHIRATAGRTDSVMVPSKSEMAEIVDYLGKHAKPET